MRWLMCVLVCEGESEREREREDDWKREREIRRARERERKRITMRLFHIETYCSASDRESAYE